METKNIAVFCGSKKGANPCFEQETIILGSLMAARGIRLIYGGGSMGLMGVVADAVMAGGGEVIGIIPEILVGWEAQHLGITDLRVVPDMHIRKRMMYELCDAAVVLPGGNGTMDELFEMLTWNTLKIHNKKIVLLNCDGYYDNLVAHIETMFNNDFLHEDWKDRLIVCETAEEAISALA
ncbi:MAG: hypothetical protein RL596_2086 [Bacteroidota bacterium]|jgi:uncharacterized protein (TIGR00730 family)